MSPPWWKRQLICWVCSAASDRGGAGLTFRWPKDDRGCDRCGGELELLGYVR